MSSSSSSLKVAPAAELSPEGVPAWKRELNDRLAAARQNRALRPEQQALLPENEKKMSPKEESRAARLAAKVAARYAAAPSYSEMLAVEARAAAAAAEVAMAVAQNAHAAAQALLADLERPREDAAAAASFAPPQAAQSQEDAWSEEPAWESDAAYLAHPGDTTIFTDSAHARDHAFGEPFPVDVVEEELVSPSQPLPVNLIEFPRELVAARRARPRLAEGPLRESAEETAHDQAQLRIFEVEHESISTAVKIDSAPPEWSSIRLDAKPSSMPTDEDEPPFSLELSLKTAPLEDRLMAGIFDVALVLLAFVLFVLVFAACTAHPPTGKAAVTAAGLVLLGLFVLYQYLCFRFTDGTPGMRYARIALCTFENENPSRKAMRRRIPYLLLSAAPLGLGLAWAWFDVDRLGWHDRMTRMYQRSYR